MKILLYVSFLGTEFCGYQIQKNARTVQQTLCEAAKAVFGFDCDITGCSRTDSGVHANMFCATLTEHGKSFINTSIPTSKIPIALCNALPSDVSVYFAEEVDEDFHARYDVEYKEYVYKIFNKQCPDPFWVDRAWHYPRKIDDMSIEKMNQAASRFIGKHDFSAYMASGSDIKDTVRTVVDARVYREGDIIVFKVSADGFLYNMVRIFVGTLIAVAEGKISPDEIDMITESCDRRRAGITAPASGLYLNRVVYKK